MVGYPIFILNFYIKIWIRCNIKLSLLDSSLNSFFFSSKEYTLLTSHLSNMYKSNHARRIIKLFILLKKIRLYVWENKIIK